MAEATALGSDCEATEEVLNDCAVKFPGWFAKLLPKYLRLFLGIDYAVMTNGIITSLFPEIHIKKKDRNQFFIPFQMCGSLIN